MISSMTGLRFMRSVNLRRRSGVLSSASGLGMLLRCGTLFSQLLLLSDSLTLLNTFRFREPITIFEDSS